MKTLAFLTAVAVVAGTAGLATADHLDDANYSDRDPENEFFICHTADHNNDRFIYNARDRDFCKDVLEGHVEFYPSSEAALHVSLSNIICYQRNPLCKAQ